jgi:hypothetical protein
MSSNSVELHYNLDKMHSIFKSNIKLKKLFTFQLLPTQHLLVIIIYSRFRTTHIPCIHSMICSCKPQTQGILKAPHASILPYFSDEGLMSEMSVK